MAFIKYLKSKLLSGHERSVRAKKNIVGLLFARGYSVLINLALIPLTLSLLDDYKYGVWITLFNVLSWISIFDIGIGHGLRNKLAEYMALGNIKEAQEYVSTGYVIIGTIALGLILLFIAPWMLLDWAKIFNVKQELANEISFLVGISFLLLCIQFGLKLINTLLTADHKPALSALIMSLSNTLILLTFVLGKVYIADSLIAIGIVYSGIPIIVLLFMNVILFSGKYRTVKPKLRLYKKEKVKDLFNLGVQFFIIQIACIVIFQTDSMIITHKISPEAVTPYNIAFRYFGVITMFASIIMAPLWSAYTEAATKNDYNWIKSVLKKQLRFFILTIILAIVLLVIAKPVIALWMGKRIAFSNTLLLGMAIYTILNVWNSIFSSLLGGLSKIRLGTFLTLITAGLNIPLSLFLIEKMNFDPGGVIFATSICLGVTAIISPIQTYYFVYSKKKTNLLTKLLS